MNRTIKFRGKRVKDGKWIYGNLADYSFTVLRNTINKKVIFSNIVSFATDNFGFVVNDCEVDPATVGQFTGLLDKNGRKIYEGDIVVDDLGNDYEICWYDDLACFMAEMICNERPFLLYDIEPNKCEIISNMHDNPELLNKK